MLPARLRPGFAASALALLTAISPVLTTGCTRPQGYQPVTPSSSVSTSTTKIAGAGVLGNQRRPDESCAAAPAALDPGAGPRMIDSGTDRGVVEVPGDPQRIVALSGDQLDALCALGLQERIVAAALPDGRDEQPSYLGTVIHNLPNAGTRSAPDGAAIADVHPDLILGSQALGAGSYGDLTAIAPTVFTGAPGPDWQDTLRTVGAATGRAAAADHLISAFADSARQAGVSYDAAHFQASVVQLTEDSVRVYGADNFPAGVLTAVGVNRPAAQRFTDKPYIEIGARDADLPDADFAAADGDIVYLSFDSPAAKHRAATVLDSDAWRSLSATHDNRVFIVNNEVWQSGQGLIAARGIVDDLRWINAPIN